MAHCHQTFINILTLFEILFLGIIIYIQIIGDKTGTRKKNLPDQTVDLYNYPSRKKGSDKKSGSTTGVTVRSSTDTKIFI